MNRFINHLCLTAGLGLALSGGSWAGPAQSADTTRAQAKLAEIRSRIAALTSRLGAELKERDTLNARLRAADLDITAKRQRLETLRAAQLAALRRRGALAAEQAHIQSELDAERAALASQVRAAYLIGPQEELKLLLNQSEPAAAGRVLIYFGYFARERAAKIDEIRAREQRLEELVAEIEQTRVKLQALETDTAHEMADLRQARTERVAAVDAVNAKYQSGNLELGELKHEEQAEEALIANLAQVSQDFPAEAVQSFAALRGKLPWPVSGHLSSTAHNARGLVSPTGLRRNGVLIDTVRGAKVRAPYFGRVVYADWLPGLGLLLILGHSGNYMTMYGHAEVLYKAVGDWVAPGDVIASVSDAGGGTTQLYFEIREGRTAVDPTLWLKAAQ